jgi:murein DD-endopeptidase
VERLKTLGAVFLLLASAFPSLAATPIRESFDIQITLPPTPVVVGGTPRLVFELHLTSFAREMLTLQRLTILDPNLRPLEEMRGDGLAVRVTSADPHLLSYASGGRRCGRR